MTPASTAATGLSTGTILLIGGVILLAGGMYYFYTQNSTKEKSSVKKLLSDEDRYQTDRKIIEEAIVEKDWETLEDMLNSSTKDFPDLIEMIKKALENK